MLNYVQVFFFFFLGPGNDQKGEGRERGGEWGGEGEAGRVDRKEGGGEGETGGRAMGRGR